MEAKYEKLFKLLIENFSDFQEIKEPGGSEKANEIVAEGLSKSIIDSMVFSADFNFVGRMKCSEVNSYSKKSGDIFTIKDSGTLNGEIPFVAKRGDVVLFDGKSFKKIFETVVVSVDKNIDQNSSNPVENKTVAASLNNLQKQIDELEPGENVQSDWSEADTSSPAYIKNKDLVTQSIANEETARQQADGELQAQIDAISSKSDVVDVVASHVELVAYDASTLGDNDVIKVLEDETHDDAESYYRWNLTMETWVYIGSQGPFVTPAEMQTSLGGKVDKVSGATANNFAALDANGNLKDSGKNASDLKVVKAFDPEYVSLSERAEMYAEIASLIDNRDFIPVIRSSKGSLLYPCWTHYAANLDLMFSGISRWGQTVDKTIIENLVLKSDGNYETHLEYVYRKADKPITYTPGRLAFFDDDGNLADRGYVPSDFASSDSVPTASTSAPQMDGVASAGTETAYARGDHRHPTDTSRQAALPTSGTASSTYAINISGNADTANNVSKIKCSSVSAVFGTEKNLNNMVCNEGEIVNVYEYGESASMEYSNRPVSSASSFRLEISSSRASTRNYNFKHIFFNGKDGKVYSRYTTGSTLSDAENNWSAWVAGI